jgi:hypothetical protein
VLFRFNSSTFQRFDDCLPLNPQPTTLNLSRLPCQNLLPLARATNYHFHSAIRAKQTPNRPRAAACPDNVGEPPVRLGPSVPRHPSRCQTQFGNGTPLEIFSQPSTNPPMDGFAVANNPQLPWIVRLTQRATRKASGLYGIIPEKKAEKFLRILVRCIFASPSLPA